MKPIYNWLWVEARVSETMQIWNRCAAKTAQAGPCYDLQEQQQREQAYDQALDAVEHEIKRAPRTKAERLATQQRIVAAFARFSASALDLNQDATRRLTDDFLPVGTQLAQWARHFDPSLSMPDIIQACRNAWTACGLQPLLGEAVKLTASILGYSLLYPYSDNYLDLESVTPELKLQFSERFRWRLRGDRLPPANQRECALWALIELIEEQYPRTQFPQVFDCLLAIHRAQEESIGQLRSANHQDPSGILRVSCGKGGSSVLADACLSRGWLDDEESRFAFEWGVLLQLGDDLQDVRDDLRRGSVTLFSRAASQGMPLDSLALQLLNFGEHVGARMDQLPHGERSLKELLKMSWRSLIIRAVAESHEFFSGPFLEEAQQRSPFRFQFLRARQDRLASRQGLYAMLFDVFLEERNDESFPLPPPTRQDGYDLRLSPHRNQ